MQSVSRPASWLRTAWVSATLRCRSRRRKSSSTCAINAERSVGYRAGTSIGNHVPMTRQISISHETPASISSAIMVHWLCGIPLGLLQRPRRPGVAARPTRRPFARLQAAARCRWLVWLCPPWLVPAEPALLQQVASLPSPVTRWLLPPPLLLTGRVQASPPRRRRCAETAGTRAAPAASCCAARRRRRGAPKAGAAAATPGKSPPGGASADADT